MILVLFTVPFYHFLFSRYLVLAEHHFLSDILVPFLDSHSLCSCDWFSTANKGWSTIITTNLWPLTTHIYHVMIIVSGDFSNKYFYYYYFYFVEILWNDLELVFLELFNIGNSFLFCSFLFCSILFFYYVITKHLKGRFFVVVRNSYYKKLLQ